MAWQRHPQFLFKQAHGGKAKRRARRKLLTVRKRMRANRRYLQYKRSR